MEKRTFLLLLLVFGLLMSGGCRQGARTDVALREAQRLPPPHRSLTSYSSFVLDPMVLDGRVREDSKKVRVAGDLERRLRDRLDPLLRSWSGSASGTGTLIIRPALQSLYIVSGGARFWVGAMAGDSTIDMDLQLIDQATGEQIGNPRIVMNSSGMGGAWSVGATDRNLLNYIVDISYNYLVENHR